MEKSSLKKFKKDEWLIPKNKSGVILGGIKADAVSYCGTSCQDDGEGGSCCEDTNLAW